jgi:hypothetical protein
MKLLLASTVALGLIAAPAMADCRASLVTAIDASSSVGQGGLDMQIAGLTAALQSPQVVSAFESQGCVRALVFLWSDGEPVVVMPWTVISSAADAENAANNLRALQYDPPTGVLTNVSQALEFAEAVLAQIPPTGQHVVNVVSDGMDNQGEDVDRVVARLKAAGVRINAVIFGPSSELEGYYRSRVTNGFVLRVGKPEDFPAVWRSKFILDLSMVQQ